MKPSPGPTEAANTVTEYDGKQPVITAAMIYLREFQPRDVPAGLKIVVHRRHQVKRSRWERFFTRPLRPWVTHRTIKPIVAPDDVFRVGDQLHMGERAFHAFEKEIAR